MSFLKRLIDSGRGEPKAGDADGLLMSSNGALAASTVPPPAAPEILIEMPVGPAPESGNPNEADGTTPGASSEGSAGAHASDSPLDQEKLDHTEDTAGEYGDEIGTPTAPTDIVHEVLKGVDVGFGYQVSGLEKQAMQLAQLWAEKGLPRHDLERSTLTEPEELLARRAREIYWGWVKTIRRRMRGATARELHKAEAQIVKARTAAMRYHRDQAQLADLQPRPSDEDRRAERDDLGGQQGASAMSLLDDLVPVEDESDDEEELEPVPDAVPAAAAPEAVQEDRVVELAHRALPSRYFFPLMILLLLADFVANSPVFTELFPSNRVIDAEVHRWVEDNLGGLLSFGPKHVGMKLLVYFEASVLALSVVLFFLWLGHTLGGALRPVVVLRRHPDPDHEPFASRLVRQSSWVIGLGLIGVVLTVVMLSVARTKITDMASERFDRAQAAHDAARAAYDKVPDGEQFDDVRRRNRDFWRSAEEELVHRQQRLDYAKSIAELNIPITGFNIVLVIAAIIAGYYREEVRLMIPGKRSAAAAVHFPIPYPAAPAPPEPDEPAKVAPPELDPRPLAVPQERLAALRANLRTHRAAMTTALAEGELALAKAEQLAGAAPFREWHGIADRLACAIPTFRAENARARGLDPTDIVAFRVSPSLDLPEPTYEPDPAHLDKLRVLRADVAELRSILRSMETSKRRDGITRPVPDADVILTPDTANA